jgi:hypothetical protein
MGFGNGSDDALAVGSQLRTTVDSRMVDGATLVAD